MTHNITRCAYPNQMAFTDSDGKKWVIHIPRKDYKRAMELFKAKDYAELAKFPAWGKCDSRLVLLFGEEADDGFSQPEVH